MEYYLTKKYMTHAIMWLNVENKKEVSQIQKFTHEIFRIGESTETKGKLVVARGWGKERTGSDC